MNNDIAKSPNKLFSGQMRSVGSWSFNENLLYMIFLQKNRQVMISKKKIRKVRVFDMMSDFMSTRNSLQCRSHHQKLLQKFGEVKNIISNLKKYISKEQYKNKVQELDSNNAFKEPTQDKYEQVEQEVLNQRSEQQVIQLQYNPPVPVQYKMQQMQMFYNDYMFQLISQVNEYSRLNLYYYGLQTFP